MGERGREFMKIDSKVAEIKMTPGDKISVRVGIYHKCDLTALPNGKLRISCDGDISGV